MKRILIVAGTSVAALLCTSAFALKVGVVDMQKIFGSQHGLRQIQAKLEKKFSGKRAKMVGMMKSIQAEQKNFSKNKAVWSQSKISSAQSKLKADQSKFQVAQAKYQKAVMSAQAASMKRFIGKIKVASSAAAKKGDLDAIFVSNSLLYAKDAKDVTASVLNNMN